MKVHPIADLFPLMPDDELAALAEDIRENGLIHPVMLDAEGQVVDGRNRVAACKLAKVEPKFEKLNGQDAKAYIVSANLARRNLSKGQQAMALAIMYPEPEKTAPGKRASTTTLLETKSVSHARLSQARAVLHQSPELAEEVLGGSLSLDDALTKVTQENAQRQSRETKIARLRREAPDLLELVEAEKLKLDEAVTILDKRIQAKQEARRAATQLLQQAMTILNPRNKSPEQWADGFLAEIHPDFWIKSPQAEFTPECVASCAAAFSTFSQKFGETWSKRRK